MSHLKHMKRDTLVNIIDGILSLVVLALSVDMFKAWNIQSDQLLQISKIFFLSLSVYRFIRAFMIRKKSRIDFIRDIISGDELRIMPTVGVLFFLAILTDRIASVIKNHTLPNILFNLAVVAALLVLGHSVIVIVIVCIVNTLKEIIGIAYSQMKMDIFWKVVRKTNAAEILFGMLLLIVAFSLVLPLLEDDIPDFTSALWYSFAIISTIGFGDVAAVSVMGRILSAILGICGLVVVSVVMSIVVNFYNETKNLED